MFQKKEKDNKDPLQNTKQNVKEKRCIVLGKSTLVAIPILAWSFYKNQTLFKDLRRQDIERNNDEAKKRDPINEYFKLKEAE